MRTAFSRFIAAFLLAATLAILSAPTASAQCPMCRMSAESNLENGGDEGRGLNTGILYMLAMPYLLVGLVSAISGGATAAKRR
jgi:hypothetical protein